MKYGFWYYQPVLHSFDIIKMLKSPEIINDKLPTKNTKYYQSDETLLKTFKLDDVLNNNELKENFINLISNHYLKTNHGNVYSPTSDNILPYFLGNNSPCFFSFYFNPLNIDIKYDEKDNNIIGSIASRPLHITHKYNSTKLDKNIDVYYVEFLCVNENYRKKGIAPQLIQTHEYNQRILNKNIKVSLFKHEDTILQGIIPLCRYNTYAYELQHSLKKNSSHLDEKEYPLNGMSLQISNLNSNIFIHKIIRIKSYSPALYDFIKQQKESNQFDVFIESSISNINELLKTNNLIIYALLNPDKKIDTIYIYKNTCVTIKTNKNPILCLTASLKNERITDTYFIYGFKKTLLIASKKYSFDYLSVENISNNNIILDDINKYNECIVVSPNAYFFYNLIFPTINSNDFFIFC